MARLRLWTGCTRKMEVWCRGPRVYPPPPGHTLASARRTPRLGPGLSVTGSSADFRCGWVETLEVLSAAVAQTNGGFRNRIHFSRFRWSRRITSAPLSDRHRQLHSPASTLGITSHFSSDAPSSTLPLSPPSFAISAGSLSPRLSLSVCLYVCSGRRGSFRCFPLFRQLSVWMNPSLDLHRIVTTCKQCRGKRRLLCLSGHTFVYHP
ncbi:hypothetical protein CMEL01_16431 [Colletotrichum melonis]|uniref:Uncharacterized protein n=1 Tax=Colletotrichum melonis TaxID=1209925 RepID=A0AAI9UI43_9PEZI|nr:hypothetical protein CMEL01_16431 [Colletotrichum melonis]